MLEAIRELIRGFMTTGRQMFGKPVDPSTTPMHYQILGFLQYGQQVAVVRKANIAVGDEVIGSFSIDAPIDNAQL